jgi:hypothetical protein
LIRIRKQASTACRPNLSFANRVERDLTLVARFDKSAFWVESRH